MMHDLGELASRLLREEAEDWAWSNHVWDKFTEVWDMNDAAKEFLGYGRESSTLGMTALFSGRFDRPHIGHLISIMKIGRRFAGVLVPVLDYPEQRYPIQYRCQVLDEALSMARGKYSVFSNKEHFGKITREEAQKYKFDIYVSGNLECILHMESLGYQTMYVERAYDYSASKE